MLTAEPIPDSLDAVVLEAPRRLAPHRIPMWPFADYGDPDMVLVRVTACGVCGSDLRYYRGENPWAQHTLGRHLDNPPNIVLGHEIAGAVVAVQSERNAHLLGQRVAPVCSKVCGACEQCRANRTQLCPHTVHLGHGQGWGDRPFFPGAYGEYVPAWGASCFPIPDGVSDEEAAMTDILAVAVHVANQGQIQPGAPVLVIGAGPAGNAIAQAAANLGASEVVVVERAPVAQAVARRQGIGTLVEGLDDVGGRSFGSVFDTVGTRETFLGGLSRVAPRGTLVNIALHDEEISVNMMAFGSERRVTTSCNFDVGDTPVALSWLGSGRFRVREWLSPLSLAEVPAMFAAWDADDAHRVGFKRVIRMESPSPTSARDTERGLG